MIASVKRTECLAAEEDRLLRERRAGETLQAQPKRLTARPAESGPPERRGTDHVTLSYVHL